MGEVDWDREEGYLRQETHKEGVSEGGMKRGEKKGILGGRKRMEGGREHYPSRFLAAHLFRRFFTCITPLARISAAVV